MPAKINLLNQKFGKLLVLKETNERKNKSVVWECQCECGNIIKCSTKELRSDGITQCPNCGHSRSPRTNLLENIIGKKFNNLTVLEKTDKTQGNKILYKCQCDCGQITYVTRTDLQSGHTKSCGCIMRKYKKNDIINNRKIIDFDNEKTTNKRFYYKVECLLCGRVYSTLSQTLDNTISCGCQKSIGEFNISQILQKNNIPYIKEYCFPDSLFRYDFAILNENAQVTRLIEFDGEQHYITGIRNSGWNTYQKYEYTFQNDLKKNVLAQEKNIPLVRIPYWERDNISIEMLLSDKYLI